MQRRISNQIAVQGIVMAAAFLFILAIMQACAGVQTVKPYELGRVTAETILFDARVLMNKKVITEAQFNEARKVYDQWKAAQDIAIDTRKLAVKTSLAPDIATANLAMSNVLILSTRLLTLAQSMGINVK